MASPYIFKKQKLPLFEIDAALGQGEKYISFIESKETRDKNFDNYSVVDIKKGKGKIKITCKPGDKVPIYKDSPYGKLEEMWWAGFVV